MPDLIIKPTVESKPEQLDLTPPAPPKVPQYKVEKLKLSDNIQKFDQKPRVYKENPFSFNAVAKKQAQAQSSTSLTATQMITDPLYNEVGKTLGVDTIHEWGLHYDKVF